jgi:SpoVK/Ycf46/Vps4 family AAA+-type ATPase
VVVKEACMEPVRNEIQKNMILTVKANNLRDVSVNDFNSALMKVRPTLTTSEVKQYN